jgi:hypothetical protein
MFTDFNSHVGNHRSGTGQGTADPMPLADVDTIAGWGACWESLITLRWSGFIIHDHSNRGFVIHEKNA